MHVWLSYNTMKKKIGFDSVVSIFSSFEAGIVLPKDYEKQSGCLSCNMWTIHSHNNQLQRWQLFSKSPRSLLMRSSLYSGGLIQSEGCLSLRFGGLVLFWRGLYLGFYSIHKAQCYYLSNLPKKAFSNHFSNNQITWPEHSEQEKTTTCSL